jgi:prolyl oligopeptidase
LSELWNYERYGLPFQRGGRYFLSRNDGLQNQSVLYWMASRDSEPQVLLDPNQLSDDGTVALMGYAASEDGRLLAYGLSAAGSDWMEWRVREVESGRDLDDLVQWVKFSGAAWTHDGQGFFYSRYDPPVEELAYKEVNEYQKLYYHRLGAPQADDALIYERPDQKTWGFDGAVTDDGRYLVISVWQGTLHENAVFYRDLHEGQGEVVELLNRFDANYQLIGNDGPLFYFLTDAGAPLSRVVAIDLRQPDPDHWREIIPQAQDTLESVSLLHGQFISVYMHDAYSMVKVFDQQGDLLRQVNLPGIGSVVGFGGRQTDRETFYQYSSFTTPGVIHRYDLESGESSVFRAPSVAFDPAAYVTDQVFYTSKDGASIPMFLTYKKDLQRNGANPTLLYGYGGFNAAMTPNFSANMLVWMEMGGIFAQACLRGGGEYGKAWHEAGMKERKQNVFDDFIAAAEWLIAQSYTSTPKLAIYGGSNGGLLVAACLAQRPDLYGACLAAVGVLDMLRFHKFTIGWAWVSEFGSPDNADEFPALLAYSPYHNLKPGAAYPPTLITTGDHDDRVFPAHSFKFAAALQAAQGGDAPVLIRIETRAGHGAGKPTAKVIEESADRFAFLVRTLGIDDW